MIRSIEHDNYTWDNPPRRDTVSTSRFHNNNQNLDEVTIRFRTDNPGPWILHWCALFRIFLLRIADLLPLLQSHIDWHLERSAFIITNLMIMHSLTNDFPSRGLAVVFAEDINGTADWQKGRPGESLLQS